MDENQDLLKTTNKNNEKIHRSIKKFKNKKFNEFELTMMRS